ncbi:hypothetical protein P8452_00534 [Trifolium repens]|nr:hypothetical protein P8452_00534 [Trifolium repens]
MHAHDHKDSKVNHNCEEHLFDNLEEDEDYIVISSDFNFNLTKTALVMNKIVTNKQDKNVVTLRQETKNQAFGSIDGE